ncbi:MAG: efflux RND transporter periplasmic adaptor subunit [Bdellovibrionota bacterium]|jgi:macrolide-specific efflux system membrane fusion protein
MTQRIIKPLIIAALLILPLTLQIKVALSQPRKETEKPLQKITVKLGKISTTVLTTGTVEPQNRLEIKPPIAGRVEEVLVNEGDQVKNGQLLAWMSSTERAALLDAARAISPAELSKWQQYYKPTPIYAPISGTVILRDVEPGQTFSNEAVFVLSDRLVVKAQVDETDLRQILLQQKATIVLDAYPQEQIPATVSHIAYEATTVNNVTTYIVDVIPEATPAFMRSGMTANITFNVETKENIIVIPQSAVKYKNGKTYVQIPAAKDKITEVQIEVGDSEGDLIEVKNGLQVGDTIYVTKSLLFENTERQVSPFMPQFRRKK